MLSKNIRKISERILQIRVRISIDENIQYSDYLSAQIINDEES